ncbi:MAG: dTDP-4-dehydrorhamnose reductase [Cyanobacteria bacterium HKST-UBA04]|nr:dTDP-4-dehydrorhamnose reductase [Cyanobacteria bacterium HKST-UBA04]
MHIVEESIIITGGTGNLGSELLQMLVDLPCFTGFLSGVGRNQVNLSAPPHAIKSALDQINPPIIINAAAYTNVDQAESEPELADQVNHVAVRAMAEWARDNGKRLIHISTDYVFDGKKGAPYTPQDSTCPINAYGKSKALGEEAIMAVYPERSTIIRTSWLYGQKQTGFVWFVINAAQAARNHALYPNKCSKPDPIKVAHDQTGTPTCVSDLCSVIIDVLQHPVYGIVHGCATGQTTRYEQALLLCQAMTVPPDFMVPQATADFNFAAPRPANTAMETSFESMPGWDGGLRAFCSYNDLHNAKRPDALESKLSPVST